MTRLLSRALALAVLCVALILQGATHPVTAEATTSSGVEKSLAHIRITAGGTVITAELVDNATSRDLLQRLPMTVTMTRAGEREYHGRPDAPISVDGPKQTSFENGDLGYWAPGGYLAIFLDKTVRPEIKDLIVMGKITSDLDDIRRLGPAVDMTIERHTP